MGVIMTTHQTNGRSSLKCIRAELSQGLRALVVPKPALGLGADPIAKTQGAVVQLCDRGRGRGGRMGKNLTRKQHHNAVAKQKLAEKRAANRGGKLNAAWYLSLLPSPANRLTGLAW